MRTIRFPALTAAAALTLLLTPDVDHGQPPADTKFQKVKPPPDESRGSSRKSRRRTRPRSRWTRTSWTNSASSTRTHAQREAKIFREIRRLYNTTPERNWTSSGNCAVLRPTHAGPRGADLRRDPPQRHAPARYRLPQHPGRAGRGRCSATSTRTVTAGSAPKKPPKGSARSGARWDRNRDGAIDSGEYGEYFQAHHESVADRVPRGRSRSSSRAAQ